MSQYRQYVRRRHVFIVVLIVVISLMLINCGRFETANNPSDPVAASLTIDLANSNDTNSSVQSLDFGIVSNLGESNYSNKSQKRVRILNTSSSAINLDSANPFTIMGKGFLISNSSCPTQLSPQTYCEVIIELNATGQYTDNQNNGAFTINQSATTSWASVQLVSSIESSQFVQDSGTPSLTIALSSNFTYQDPLNRSYRILSIRNNGSGPLTNLAVNGLGNDYSSRLTSCSTFLLAGESCFVEISFNGYASNATPPDQVFQVVASNVAQDNNLNFSITATSQAQQTTIQYPIDTTLPNDNISVQISVNSARGPIVFSATVNASSNDGLNYHYSEEDITSALVSQNSSSSNVEFTLTQDSNNVIVITGPRGVAFTTQSSITAQITNTQEATP